MDLSNKVVLVTGGNRGIGAATVKLLWEKGATVLVHFNSHQEEAQALYDECKGLRVHLIQADLSQSEGTENLWTTAIKYCKKIDAIVNSAGTMKAADIGLPYQEWKDIWDFTMQLNVISLAWLSREAAKYFAMHDGGIIINISSRAAYIGSPDANYLNYAASKGAVMSLTKTIARSYAKKNVLAYVIAPGLVETDMTMGFIQEKGAHSIEDSIPLGEIAKPYDIAEMIVFLATGKARQATGSTFHINGGSYL